MTLRFRKHMTYENKVQSPKYKAQFTDPRSVEPVSLSRCLILRLSFRDPAWHRRTADFRTPIVMSVVAATHS
jgi:hypothetical protein